MSAVKRHQQLPLTNLPRSSTKSPATNARANDIDRMCGGRLNQVFVVVCMGALCLQLLGSYKSWGFDEPMILSASEKTAASAKENPKPSKSRHRTTGEDGEVLVPEMIAEFLQEEESKMGEKKEKKAKGGEKTAKGSATEQDSKSTVVEQVEYIPASIDTLPEHLAYGSSKHKGRLRVLVGILTADFPNDHAYRKRHRELFKLWNDTRVCSLPDFKSKPINERYQCQFIYTFVIGANPKESPELCDDSRPMEIERPYRGKAPDLNEPDVTLLNIRENMNEGKSQTWMKYGADIAEQWDLDYVVKCDADSLWHLHDFFEFAYEHLPPAPFNKHMYVGALRDKAYWPRHTTEKERIRFESYFGNNFDGVHLYVAGQMYIMSTDLARFTGQEAITNKCSYCEGHEDHDISAMAFHSPQPVKLVVIGRNQRFWEHPVKGEPRWRRMWARETARMAGKPFEGKTFNTNSTFEAVMGYGISLKVE